MQQHSSTFQPTSDSLTAVAPTWRQLLIPFALSALLVVLDQLTKWWIVENVPLYYSSGYAMEVLGDFFRIIHARNLGVAFSMGHGLPETVRRAAFIVLPIVVLTVMVLTLYRSAEVTQAQRWMLAGIVGGGVGNLIDRIFRPMGVVDFLDFRFYGLFGLERWPTFNVADASVVVGGVLLVLTSFWAPRGQSG